jgi:hypothetical protein
VLRYAIRFAPSSSFYPRELAKLFGYTSCFVVVVVAVVAVVAVTCLLVLYSIKQLVTLPLQQGSHARMQFGILPLQQGSSAHSCMQFGILLLQQGSSASLQDRYCGELGVTPSGIAGTFDIAGNQSGDPVSDCPQCRVWHFGQVSGAGPHFVVKIPLNTYFLHYGEPGSRNLSHFGFCELSSIARNLAVCPEHLGRAFLLGVLYPKRDALACQCLSWVSAPQLPQLTVIASVYKKHGTALWGTRSAGLLSQLLI